MNELLIEQNKVGFKTKPLLVFLISSFFTLATYLKTGFSTQTQAMLFFTIAFTAWGSWYLYTASKKLILINKSTEQIQVTELSFWGKLKHKKYSLNNFGAVQSYITRVTTGMGAVHIVELVSKDGNRGLVLSTFLPCGNRRFWSLEIEKENPNAIDLASKVADFIPVNNLGFIGHKFVTNQIGIEDETKYISNMF